MSSLNQRYLNKVVLVTGSGSGIGKAIALEFAKEGALLVLGGRTESKLVETANLLKSRYGTNSVYYAGDLGSEDVNKKLVELAIKEFGRLDVAINNAGSFIMTKITEEQEKNVTTMLNSNIKSIIWGSKYQLPAIGKTSTPDKQGSVIYISSGASLRPAAGGSVYGATKGFVDTFTLAIAKEAREFNVRVNAVNPGVTVSEGALKTLPLDQLTAFVKSASLADTPATGEEIASFVLDVVSNRYINGSRLLVDGGYNAV